MKGLEQHLVETYINRIRSVRMELEAKLHEKGYAGDDGMALRQFCYEMAEEVKGLFQNRASIIGERAGKLGIGDKEEKEALLSLDIFLAGGEVPEKESQLTEDYEAVIGKVSASFDDRFSIVPGDGIRAVHLHYNDLKRFGSTKLAMYHFAAERCHDIQIHEKLHEKQHEKHDPDFLYFNEAFKEGDAEVGTLKELEAGSRDLKSSIRTFISLAAWESDISSKRDDFEKNGIGEQDYVFYILSPSIMLHLEERGKSEGEIKQFFAEASQKAPMTGLKKALLSELIKII